VDDNRLKVSLSTPKGLGGDDGQGTNPEQLFAAGYAACFIGAIDSGFAIAVKLVVSSGDMDKAGTQSMVEKAH
jgi:osmotically inducible protein OsmC